ncbi:MAG: hypothetical protein J2P36_10615 [Ktedonobacteraceae bacterium]|nr:hypothetical protein [Ktedonobacteraceae bacterium]
MPKKRSGEPENPFLAQMLFRYVSTDEMCQGAAHRYQKKKPGAEWETRFYQNTERALDLLRQGTEHSKVDQIVWDEACREQDTIGVRVHRRAFLCSACALQIINQHVGEASTTLAMVTAQATNRVLLLVSDRLTENAAVVGNVPDDIQERDILPKLKQEHMLDIRFRQ